MAHCVNRSSQEFKALAEQSNINPIILAAKVSLWQEKNGLDNFPTINTLFQLRNSNMVEPSIEELDKYLLNFMKLFGVQSKQFDELKSKLGVDALGATDVLNKLIWYTKNRNAETIPEEVGHMAVMLMGKDHTDINELLGNIENWSEYSNIYAEYMPIYKDEDKVKVEAIGKLIAKSLVKNYKEVGVDKTLIEKAFNILKKIFHKLLSGSDMSNIFLYNENVADHIALNILSGNKEYIRKITNLNPNLNYEKEINANPFAKALIGIFANKNVKVTGSIAVAAHGENIRRPEGEGVHDIDFKVKSFDVFQNEILPQLENLNSIPAHYGWHKKDYSTFAYLVAEKGLTIKVLERKDDFSNGWITNYELYNEKGEQIAITQKNVVALDFFVYKEDVPYEFETSSLFSPGSLVYEGKLSLSGKSNPYFFNRDKDQEDYVLREPKSFLPAKNAVYYQEQDIESSKASEETVAMMRKAAEQMGINIQDLLDYAKANPNVDVKNVNGLADIIKKTIAIAQGKEDVTLVEEIVHVATAMLEQTNPKLITELISKIDRFKIYKEVFEVYSKKKEYQLANGKPDIRKIKKEAVDKLIAEVVVYQSEGSTQYPELMQEETRNIIQNWWQTILDYIRGMYKKSNIDIFQEAGMQVVSGEIQSTGELVDQGIYYQLGDNVKAKIDNFYNKVKDIAKDMILVDEIKDSTGEVTEKRHYTYKGERVATTITEKIKKGKVFKERTPEEKIIDDQKKEWGSEGHRFIEKNLLENFIDQDGYALPNFGNKRIESKLPLDVQKQLYAFCKELIASYPKGTRFLIEEKVANLKEKGMIGSTVDFKAIYPVEKKDGTQDMKIDTLDWKFTTVDKTKDQDIPFYKKRDWVPQMGQYVAIDYTYGAKQDQIGKSRMIPFVVNYDYTIAGDKKSGLYPQSLEIGKLNSLEETNLYLLPVPVATETTGNPEVDKLIASLQSQWDKLWEKKVSPGLEKDKKTLDLNELSKAIRYLHLKLDFEPLVNVGKTFLNNAADAIKEIKNLDFAKLSEEELNKKLGDLISYKASAEKYAGMDDTFLAYYPRKELTPEGLKIVDSLTAISRSTEVMLKTIEELEKKFVMAIALKEGFVTEDTQKSALQAEAAISSMEQTLLEGSKLSSKIINLAVNLIQVAQKLVNSKVRTQIKQFGEVLLPLENEARSKGKKAFDLIATKTDGKMLLIKKIDPQFWEKVKEAKKEKNKQFFLNNINLEKYNELAKEAIEQRIADALKREYSSDPETNERYKEYNIEAIKNGLDITSASFNGYDNKTFGYLFSKSFKEEKNYSKEYTEMSKSKAALDVWNFFTNLNKRAEGLGYIGEYQDSFFPLIEATTLEKFYQTNDVSAQTKDFFTDFYRMKIDEEQQYSKRDLETGKIKKNIPKFFTRTDKNIEQLSTDLNKVGALWIKSLEEYESKKNLENVLLTLHSVEKGKGNLILENNKVVFNAGIPMETDENKNAELLTTIIDDELYGLKENLNSIGNIGLSSVAGKLGKTGEDVEKFEIATKKVIQTGDTLVQALAVGLKPLIAIANWTGQQFQSAIQAGGYYNFWGDYEKNNLKITTNNLSTLEKGLLDLVVPLNEDVSLEERRKLAWKKGFTNYLATWSFTDVMMVSNAFPEKLLQFANAMSFNDNAMVVDGKIVNIRQYLREQDRKTKYAKDANNNYIMSEAERKALEKTFEKRVDELKASPSALKNVAKIENGEVIIPGVSERELAKYSLTITEYARTLNGQMSLTNKAGYRRDAIFSSFMMFKNWIPKLVNVRTGDIKKNVELNTWEYGRTRAFFKTAAYLGRTNILSMIDIINGSEKGLKILDDLLESKRQEHYKKTGQELEITNEEFYDLMREQLWNQSKELMLLFSLLTMCFAAAAAEPPEDATDAEKNAYKWYAKMLNKITDEVAFYYNPLSFESMTKGSLLPSIGILSKAIKMLDQVGTEGVGMLIDDEEMMKKAHGLKYTLNIIPGLAQIQTEILPYLYPELAKEMGIRVSKEARR